jgi:hypothetical protein
MRTRTKKACQGDTANKKLKEQLLDRATYCSSTGLGLKHSNLNKKMIETYVFHAFADICHKTCN